MILKPPGPAKKLNALQFFGSDNVETKWYFSFSNGRTK